MAHHQDLRVLQITDFKTPHTRIQDMWMVRTMFDVPLDMSSPITCMDYFYRLPIFRTPWIQEFQILSVQCSLFRFIDRRTVHCRRRPPTESVTGITPESSCQLAYDFFYRDTSLFMLALTYMRRVFYAQEHCRYNLDRSDTSSPQH